MKQMHENALVGGKQHCVLSVQESEVIRSAALCALSYYKNLWAYKCLHGSLLQVQSNPPFLRLSVQPSILSSPVCVRTDSI